MRVHAAVLLIVVSFAFACAGAPAGGAGPAPGTGEAAADARAPAVPAPSGDAAAACRRTGCSGELCADEDLMSACVVRPEHACYRAARCERQPDGRCGFTPDEALARCLEAAGR